MSDQKIESSAVAGYRDALREVEREMTIALEYRDQYKPSLFYIGNSVEVWRDRLRAALADPAPSLLIVETDLPEAAARILRDNLWSLYDDDQTSSDPRLRAAPSGGTANVTRLANMLREAVTVLDEPCHREAVAAAMLAAADELDRLAAPSPSEEDARMNEKIKGSSDVRRKHPPSGSETCGHEYRDSYGKDRVCTEPTNLHHGVNHFDDTGFWWHRVLPAQAPDGLTERRISNEDKALTKIYALAADAIHQGWPKDDHFALANICKLIEELPFATFTKIASGGETPPAPTADRFSGQWFTDLADYVSGGPDSASAMLIDVVSGLRHAALAASPPAPTAIPTLAFPVRWDGQDLLDATNRIIVWGKESADDRDDIDRSLGKWVAETLNQQAALAASPVVPLIENIGMTNKTNQLPSDPRQTGTPSGREEER